MKGLKKFLSLILVVSVMFSTAPNVFALGEIDVLLVGTPAAKAKFLRILDPEKEDDTKGKVKKEESKSQKGSEFKIGESKRVPGYRRIRHVREEGGKIRLLVKNADDSSAPTSEVTEPVEPGEIEPIEMEVIESAVETVEIDMKPSGAGEIYVVIAAVDADQELDKVKSDIRELVDKICDKRSGQFQILVVGCAENQGGDGLSNKLSNFVTTIERECNRSGWGTDHKRVFKLSSQFLSFCGLYPDPGYICVRKVWNCVGQCVEWYRKSEKEYQGLLYYLRS